MVEMTIRGQSSPQTSSQLAYVDCLVQWAVCFADEIGIDPGQVSALIEAMLSPVD